MDDEEHVNGDQARGNRGRTYMTIIRYDIKIMKS